MASALGTIPSPWRFMAIDPSPDLAFCAMAQKASAILNIAFLEPPSSNWASLMFPSQNKVQNLEKRYIKG
ncbi:unnamed protein product [Eruca vesicaria subsp. sativa]|uniref:Uncharacterized protein n=1 Tax=Eruca vesicaria subsp. sativa TaxID=29727 RepID=A0ABC8LUT6_ERUVS|nr:unnamed protein product [Eruca vesicaria subsp. sativa]